MHSSPSHSLCILPRPLLHLNEVSQGARHTPCSCRYPGSPPNPISLNAAAIRLQKKGTSTGVGPPFHPWRQYHGTVGLPSFSSASVVSWWRFLWQLWRQLDLNLKEKKINSSPAYRHLHACHILSPFLMSMLVGATSAASQNLIHLNQLFVTPL